MTPLNPQMELPPTMDCAPEFCFCGRRTVESHEFWYCSTKCARLDSLRSLDKPECHYRKVVQAYVQSGGPTLQPRRIVSADDLRPRPSGLHPFAVATSPFNPPTNLAHQGNLAPLDCKITGLPTLSQVTDKVLIKKAVAGKPLVVEKHDRPRWEGFANASCARRGENTGDHTFEQISLEAIPLPDHVPVRSLRRVPSSIGGHRNSPKKPLVTAFQKLYMARKAKDGDDRQKIFGHSVSPVVPPARKESLPWHRRMDPVPTVPPVQTAKALRRSVSFAGWDAATHRAIEPSEEQESLMQILEEMGEELSENFDLRS